MTGFNPTFYAKQGCPHCFKLRLFLLETGQLGRFTFREWTPGSPEEAAIKAELAPHFGKVTFPTVQYAPGRFQNESDDLIARYATEAGADPASLPVYLAYAEGLLPRLRRLNAENKALSAQLAALEH